MELLAGQPLYVQLAPFLAALVLLEALVYRRLRGHPYQWKASLASLTVFLGALLFGRVNVYLTSWIGEWLARRDLGLFPSLAEVHWLVLFLGFELAYYWGHRMLHEIRFGWASHAVHHSSNQLSLAAAARLNWTNTLSFDWVFYLPLYWLGADPAALGFLIELNFLYQFFLHTELCPRLGPLEWILNTPSAHRVHHACNPGYVNRNYGAMLVVFDRIFGTYARELPEEPCEFGVVPKLHSSNPIVIVFHEWGRLLVDVWRARTARQALGIALLPSPGAR